MEENPCDIVNFMWEPYTHRIGIDYVPHGGKDFPKMDSEPYTHRIGTFFLCPHVGESIKFSCGTL